MIWTSITGWLKRKTTPADLGLFLVVAAVLCTEPVLGAEISGKEAAVHENEANMPSMELLEFLGSWETDAGEWIDPALVEQMPLPDRETSDEK
jgi:hypothetical protein